MKFRNPRVLVAEDDPVNAQYLEKLLSQEGFDVEIAEDGEKAFSLFLENPFDVVISDLHMPVMGGDALLEKIQTLEEPPVFIVETAETDKTTIVEMMKNGVADYFFKPIQAEEFLVKVHKAVEIANLRKTKKLMEEERQARLENNLDWNILKERVVARSYDKFDKALFSSLKSSFSQGAGLGSMVSMASFIEQAGKVEDGNFIVKEAYIEPLFHNAKIATKSLNAISEIYNLLEKDLDLSEVNLDEFDKAIRETVKKNQTYVNIKENKILFNDVDYSLNNRVLTIHLPSMLQAFEELLINALKFSQPRTEIYIFTGASKKRFYISIMNLPDGSLVKSMKETKDYERLMFEPFFRLANFVYEDYHTVDFGLGLTMVEKIIRKNMGKIMISRVQDESTKKNSIIDYRLSLEISLPLNDLFN